MLDEQLAQEGIVDGPIGQGLVETAVRSAELRLEAEGGHRAHRRRRAQDRVTELEEGVAPGGEAAVERRAEPGQLVGGGVGVSMQTVCLLSATR